jgi:hypothetical protein
MKTSLRLWMLVTDIGFLLYWAVSGLALIGVITLSSDWMYGGYDDPRVVAWNWSFLSIDLPFSLLGLVAVAAERASNPVWRPLAILSLAFTIAAGAMAVSYWALLQEWNPSWFVTNLTLVIWPLFYLPGLVRGTAQDQEPQD